MFIQLPEKTIVAQFLDLAKNVLLILYVSMRYLLSLLTRGSYSAKDFLRNSINPHMLCIVRQRLFSLSTYPSPNQTSNSNKQLLIPDTCKTQLRLSCRATTCYQLYATKI